VVGARLNSEFYGFLVIPAEAIAVKLRLSAFKNQEVQYESRGENMNCRLL
jgi:hypothetical protein